MINANSAVKMMEESRKTMMIDARRNILPRELERCEQIIIDAASHGKSHCCFRLHVEVPAMFDYVQNLFIKEVQEKAGYYVISKPESAFEIYWSSEEFICDATNDDDDGVSDETMREDHAYNSEYSWD